MSETNLLGINKILLSIHQHFKVEKRAACAKRKSAARKIGKKFWRQN
jgi:hypothetical protein